ncbi:MAG: hypothetical protein M3Y77_19925 [Actinomycetota bacterium]|nr:hypothetical protein [Actinomycetota bacterium]
MMVPLATVTVIGWTGDKFVPPIAGLDDTVATGGTGLGVAAGFGFEVVIGTPTPGVFRLDDEPTAGNDAPAVPPPAVPPPAVPPPDPTVIGAPDAAGLDPVSAVVETAELPMLCWPELAPCCGEPADDGVHAASNAVAATRVSTGAKPRVMRIVTSSRVSVPQG